MSGIETMKVGKKYLVGDSLGYDKVECIAVNPPEEMKAYDYPSVGVKVRYLDSGIEDFFFENIGCGFSTYVEELSE